MSAGFDFSPRKKGFLDEQRRRGEIVQIVRWRGGGGVDKGLRMFIIEGLAINLEGVSRVESGTEIFVTVCLLFCLKMIFKYIRQRVLREMNCQNCFKRNREIPSTIIVCLNAYTETNFLQF